MFIKKLDEATASQIAAGEVVEKPAMVVKELVENAIDSGAKEIIVAIEKGGKKGIRVTDNGSGIAKEDLPLVFERHATSKIEHIDDLYRTQSLGFRGEALASIGAVSQVTLITMTADNPLGYQLKFAGGKLLQESEVGTTVGTTIKVQDLFFNTPARLKFLKSDVAETRYITELMNSLALSHASIAFKYIVDEKIIFQTPGKGKVKEAIFSVYEKNLVQHLFPIENQERDLSVTGYASTFEYTKGNKSMQIIFVNGRFIKSEWIKEVIQMVYKPYLMNNRHPVCFLFITVPPHQIDVNIHPAKTEVKFHEEGRLKQLIFVALKKAIHLHDQMPKISLRESDTFVKKREEAEVEPIKVSKENMPGQPQDFRVNKPIENKHPENKRPENKPPQIDFNAYESLFDQKTMVQDERETFVKPIEKTSVYEDLHYIGEFDQTYLLFQKENTLFLMDQHAAHEKVLYEQLMQKYHEEKIHAQHIMAQDPIELSPLSYQGLVQQKTFLQKMGFEFDPFGERTVVLRAIPALLSEGAARVMFMDLAEGLHVELDDIVEEQLAQKACKAAVKANQKLEKQEVLSLLEQLKHLREPYTCPHGRPLIVAFSKVEIEKKFKRII